MQQAILILFFIVRTFCNRLVETVFLLSVFYCYFHEGSKNIRIRIYKATILPVVRYGCESWSPTLKEEPGLRMFGNRVLRRIFGPKKDDVTVWWRELHNEELHDLYSSLCIMRGIRWAGHVERQNLGYW
jgi:hypothetical protein